MPPGHWGIALGISLSFWVVAALFLIPLRHRRWAALSAVSCTAVGLLLQLAFWLLFLPAAGWPEWAVTLLHIALAICLFHLCAQLTFPAVCYCTIWTVSIHELGIQIYWIVFAIGEIVGGAHLPFPCTLIGCLCTAAFFIVIGLTLARWMPERGRYEIGPRQFGGAVFSFSVLQVLVFLSGGRWLSAAGWSDWPLLMLMELYCVTLLYIQHEMFKKSAMRQELSILNRIQAQQKSQYALARENVALINRKCHDLKHQLRALRVLYQDEQREQYLREMEGIVNAYDATVFNTGNKVLDTVLTEKSLYCQANAIQANCVADGKRLDFIDPVDLYTIFGNALDNAIEHVKELEEPEKRIIDVMVYQENQFVIVQIINPIAGSLQFDEDGMPLTTKEDKRYHGFGLKSIRQTSEQYGGFLTIAVENGCFCLRILFPKPASDERE